MQNFKPNWSFTIKYERPHEMEPFYYTYSAYSTKYIYALSFERAVEQALEELHIFILRYNSGEIISLIKL